MQNVSFSKMSGDKNMDALKVAISGFFVLSVQVLCPKSRTSSWSDSRLDRNLINFHQQLCVHGSITYSFRVVTEKKMGAQLCISYKRNYHLTPVEEGIETK